MRVEEIMTRPVTTCGVEARLNEVARLMWDHDCGVIPLVDDEGRLAGIITDRDITMAAYTQGRPLAEIPARSAMASAVLSCPVSASIETAERVMSEGRVRRVPVVDGEGRPVGLVSMNDLARQAARRHRSAVDREIVDTLAAICEPHAGVPHEQMNHSAGIVLPA
jgi:CBS domain-containing protein